MWEVIHTDLTNAQENLYFKYQIQNNLLSFVARWTNDTHID